jgi:hypothetical protein
VIPHRNDPSVPWALLAINLSTDESDFLGYFGYLSFATTHPEETAGQSVGDSDRILLPHWVIPKGRGVQKSEIQEDITAPQVTNGSRLFVSSFFKHHNLTDAVGTRVPFAGTTYQSPIMIDNYSVLSDVWMQT